MDGDEQHDEDNVATKEDDDGGYEEQYSAVKPGFSFKVKPMKSDAVANDFVHDEPEVNSALDMSPMSYAPIGGFGALPRRHQISGAGKGSPCSIPHDQLHSFQIDAPSAAASPSELKQ